MAPRNVPKRISLAYRGFREIPADVPPRLVAVEELDLSNNELSDLHCLTGLDKLRVLVLDHNRFTHFVRFPRLSALHTLSINHNQISNLAVFITTLVQKTPNLRHLSMLCNEACPNFFNGGTLHQYNDFRSYVIARMSKLVHLDCQGVTRGEQLAAAKLYSGLAQAENLRVDAQVSEDLAAGAGVARAQEENRRAAETERSARRRSRAGSSSRQSAVKSGAHVPSPPPAPPPPPPSLPKDARSAPPPPPPPQSDSSSSSSSTSSESSSSPILPGGDGAVRAEGGTNDVRATAGGTVAQDGDGGDGVSDLPPHMEAVLDSGIRLPALPSALALGRPVLPSQIASSGPEVVRHPRVEPRPAPVPAVRLPEVPVSAGLPSAGLDSAISQPKRDPPLPPVSRPAAGSGHMSAGRVRPNGEVRTGSEGQVDAVLRPPTREAPAPAPGAQRTVLPPLRAPPLPAGAEPLKPPSRSPPPGPGRGKGMGTDHRLSTPRRRRGVLASRPQPWERKDPEWRSFHSDEDWSDSE